MVRAYSTDVLQSFKDGDAGELPSRAPPPLQEVGVQNY